MNETADVTAMASQMEGQTRKPQHKKQPSRSNILKALVSPTKSKPENSKNGAVTAPSSPTKISRSQILGERHSNVQSPPASPQKHPKANAEQTSIGSREYASSGKTASHSSREAIVTAKSTLSPKKSPQKHAPESSTFGNAFGFGKKSAKGMTALQGKPLPADQLQQPPQLNETNIEAEFEAMLDARHIPAAMRQSMRDLTVRVKLDLIKQNRDSGNQHVDEDPVFSDAQRVDTDEPESTKRARPRSRTFTFSRSDRSMSFSPLKKQRSRSRPRGETLASEPAVEPSTPRTPRTPSRTRRSKIERPEDYIEYLQAEQDPTKVEVGRLHKLRILIRNETVGWVNAFIDLNGMSFIVALLNSIMVMEWREEHEDQLLHETLLCLKGLCTTDTALAELDKYAQQLFPALLAMLFDDEKKGPAEYPTRGVIINILSTLR